MVNSSLLVSYVSSLYAAREISVILIDHDPRVSVLHR